MTTHDKTGSTLAATANDGRLVVIAQTVHVDLTDDEDDPIDYPCEECGAQPGEQCRPFCTALPE